VRETLLVVLAALVLGATWAEAGVDLEETPAESRLLAEINRVRAAHGLPALQTDARLVLAARTHSRNLLSSGVLAHGSIARRLRSFGVRSQVIGENLAWNSGDRVRTRWLVSRWLASPSHRAVLLERSFRWIGIGTAAGSFQGHSTARVVTTDFAG
jgi:uncharacterized protein YkwD